MKAKKVDNKQEIMPFFPLGVFLLPGEDMPLRIFEPRYLQLIEEARQQDFTFVIPFMKDEEMMEYGCEVKLQQVVAESVQGQKVITVESVNIVRIISFTSQMKGKLYGGGRIERVPAGNVVTDRSLFDLVVQYTDHFDKEFLSGMSADDLYCFDVVRALNLSSEDKYRFINMNCTEKRQQYLIRHIQYLMLIRNQEKMLNDDFRLN